MTSISYSQDNMSRSLQGAFGAVTIDGKIWNQIALRPVIPIGKISVALDIVFYIDQDGNVFVGTNRSDSFNPIRCLKVFQLLLTISLLSGVIPVISAKYGTLT